jgi:DNA-binding transcriptional regulator YiaG
MSAEEVRRIRAKTKLSRANFARRFGFDEKTVRRWETGDKAPHAHNAVLLTLIDRVPDICNRVAAELRRTKGA